MNPPLSIEKIVEKHSWKSILLNLIYEGKIDPWDIDIDVVIDEFIKNIKNMKELDLYIPGNLILATSILLKYKSLYIMVEEQEEQEEPLEFEEINLNMAKRIKPDRPITLNELVEVIEETMEININEAIKRKTKPVIRQTFNKELFTYKKEDIEKVIHEISKKLLSLMDSYGLVRFNELFKNSKDSVVEFLALLHMENEAMLTLKQEKPFSEVLIYVNKERIGNG